MHGTFVSTNCSPTRIRGPLDEVPYSRVSPLLGILVLLVVHGQYGTRRGESYLGGMGGRYRRPSHDTFPRREIHLRQA